MTTYQKLREFQTGGSGLDVVAFSRDGRALATGVGPAIRLWDVHTGKETLSDRGHTAELHYCSLLPDQRTLITGTTDGTVRHWDLATAQEVRPPAAVPTSNRGIVLSPNGKIAAAFKNKPVGQNAVEVGIQLWDLASQKEGALLWVPNLSTAFFSPDGKVLLTQGWDIKENAGIIRSWDVATGKELRVLARHSNAFDYTELSPDGKVIAALLRDAEKTIRSWDVATGKELCRIPGDPNFHQCFALSPDSKLLAVVDGWRPISSRLLHRYVHLWEIATGKKLRQFGESRGDSESNGYQSIAFSPNGRTLATAGDGNRIRLWEVVTGSERLLLEGHAGRVIKLLFAENGKTLISTSSDTTALVWDLTGLRAQGLPEEKRMPSDLGSLWSALAEPNATKAYQAIWRLAATPSPSLEFLKGRLHAVTAADENALAQLITDLDSSVYLVRQKATRELSKLDRLAEPALRKALAGNPSPELRQRIQQLLEQLEGVPYSEQLQAFRAVEALEIADTPEARRLLDELAKGAPEARLTQDAKASLERLTKRSSGTTGGRK
jgi:WD40 repeat protein